MATYLLPCSCGRKIALELRQAGEVVQCACGKTQHAPTMLQIRNLEKTEVPASNLGRASSFWGLPQRLVMLGILILVVAAGLTAWFYWHRPLAPTTSQVAGYVEERIEEMTPLATWEHFHKELLPGLSPEKSPFEKAYVDALFQYRAWLGVSGLLAALGAALIVAGAWMPRQRAPASSTA